MSGYPDGQQITLIPERDSVELTPGELTRCLSLEQPDPKKKCRDRIIRVRMAWVDQKFYQFEKSLREESVKSDLGVDLAGTCNLSGNLHDGGWTDQSDFGSSLDDDSRSESRV